ncbi:MULTISPECIES: hypothetical protein [unclassified Microbacterium]|uniref:hypothetical protein n=1 Tax=unclassified Microbacterium TaxID=2609290 RepID=UPI0026033038|nr:MULTISPECIES: hypothetical protein [unclassified Microbacterium]MCV0333923.1 hypothetical protein [Microbacterium sp.]MCV0374549.1 hypothetical protein [Microbacterium sp.]MCV0389621.1 hypothetical protein [Microbacterium sp.]MCV0419156.1 hypothetical protein [Microbacterium sp.]MCV0421461.1 hypothetical protein [Microbacterium sp.]
MTPSDALAGLGVAVAVLTVIITVIVARHGWEQDRDHRDASLEAECVKAMCKLIDARYAPLDGTPWNQFEGVAANEHHTTAIAAMNAVSAQRRDHDFLRFIAIQAIAIQEEAIRYRKSADHENDIESGAVGDRRGAIFGAAIMLQEDLLLWQRHGSKQHVRSFWSHYADELLNRSRIGPTPA